jgi:hypothetical protein
MFGKVKHFSFRLESVETVSNGKNQNVLEVNRFETFRPFVLHHKTIK